jgi:hypothetical protein
MCAPGWRAEAKKKTDGFKRSRRYNETKGNWSKIKPAYMALQKYKCAYCERRLEGAAYGAIEHDVEHYRPKSSIVEWPTEKMKRVATYAYTFPTGASSAVGYYLLPYELFNYATACKPCNSTLKRNFFPIAGKRKIRTVKLSDYKAEKPYLVYPIGSLDDDPEDLIAFEGALPIPNPNLRNGHRRNRAKVTIDFFSLDIRDNLLKERAEIIDKLWLALTTAADSSIDQERKSTAQRIIDIAVAESSPHTNCARSFVMLYQRDRLRAKSAHEAAVLLLDT